mmetsp:Transcript_111/g.186  ORF Transcript_111/g.186 Transcript_111/m.186 type:complete len:187 (-) Transcript_111:1-561(-)
MQTRKVVVVGNTATGKTSLINRFVNGAFQPNADPTLGIDIATKVLRGPSGSVKLQLWDTAGQERFRSLVASYLRDSSGCVVVFDMTNSQSFHAVTEWVDEVKKERGDDVAMLLVASKSDLESQRTVSTEEGSYLSEQLGIGYLEASAKTGCNVEDIFVRLASMSASGNRGAGVRLEDAQRQSTCCG